MVKIHSAQERSVTVAGHPIGGPRVPCELLPPMTHAWLCHTIQLGMQIGFYSQDLELLSACELIRMCWSNTDHIFLLLGIRDTVQCFSCGAYMWKWEEGDDPLEDHTRFYPKWARLTLNVLQQSLLSNLLSLWIVSAQLPVPTMKDTYFIFTSFLPWHLPCLAFLS